MFEYVLSYWSNFFGKLVSQGKTQHWNNALTPKFYTQVANREFVPMRFFLFLITILLSSQVLAQSETEPNNIQQRSDIISGEVSGSLSSDDDSDWFEFTASSAGPVVITFTVDASYIRDNWHIQVQDSSGTILTGGLTGISAVYTTNLPTAGTFYIHVFADPLWGHEADQYTITLDLDSSLIAETEINDTQETANTFVSGIVGNLPTGTDEDWYTFTGNKTGTISLDFEVDSDISYQHWNVAILDSGGIILSAGERGRSFELATQISFGQTYFIRVMPMSNELAISDQYQLTLNSNPNFSAERELNDNLETANELDDSIRGNLSSFEDEDWYFLNAINSGTYTLDFSTSRPGHVDTWDIAIISSQGEILTGGVTGDTLNLSINLSGGSIYYVRVQHNSGVVYAHLYTLDVARDSNLVSESNSNDSAETADDLVNGIVANISSETDEDWFIIDAGGRSTLNVELVVDVQPFSIHWNVSILDSNGNILVESDARGSINLNTLIPAGGSYFVRISKGSTGRSDSSQYTLSFELTESTIESATAAQVYIAQCATDSNCLNAEVTPIDLVKTIDNGISSISEISLFDSDLGVESASLANLSGSNFTPSIEVYAYTSESNRVAISATSMQSYRFVRDGTLSMTARLNYSQSGGIDTADTTSFGMADLTVRTFQIENDELDLTRCNAIATGEYTADIHSFTLCLRFPGIQISASTFLEIDGLENLSESVVIGDLEEYPPVESQNVEKDIEIQGVEGDVFFLHTFALIISHSGGFAEINNFSFEFNHSEEDLIVEPAFSKHVEADLPSRTISTDISLFTDAMIIPLIEIDDSYYYAEFLFVPESDPLQMQLVYAKELFHVSGTDPASFEGEILLVPNLEFNGESYTIELRIVDPESLKFELVNFFLN